jgi:HEAT repeat protein
MLTCQLAGCATGTAKAPAEEGSPPTQSAAALKQGSVREQVDGLLDRSASLDEWRQLGPDALSVLEQIFNDPAAQPDRRTRALIAIGHLEHPNAMERIKGVVRDANADVRYRSTAVLALGHRGGPAVVPDIQPFLSASDLTLRQAAVRALGNAGGADARRSLEEQLAKEEDPSVREVIQQSLTKLQP